MKRKSILIESSNVAGQKALPGARIDIENWTAYLKSELGGAWESEEIRVLRKPSSTELTKELAVATDCYCFVAFSGHGSEGSIVLNDLLDSYSIAQLRPKSNWGTLIVDACRGVASGERSFRNRAIALANAADGSRIALNSKEGRSTYMIESHRTWDTFRRKWENGFSVRSGIIDMLACSKGQGAAEDPAAGGYYTSLLMAAAEEWMHRSTSAKIHTTKDAHDFAAANLPTQQTPQYFPSHLRFPFAVKE